MLELAQTSLGTGLGTFSHHQCVPRLLPQGPNWSPWLLSDYTIYPSHSHRILALKIQPVTVNSALIILPFFNQKSPKHRRSSVFPGHNNTYLHISTSNFPLYFLILKRPSPQGPLSWEAPFSIPPVRINCYFLDAYTTSVCITICSSSLCFCVSHVPNLVSNFHQLHFHQFLKPLSALNWWGFYFPFNHLVSSCCLPNPI